MVVAAMTCPPSLRIWVWCKLIHFENLGPFRLGPIKKNLALLWNMPEILVEGFSWRTGSSDCESRIFEVDDSDIPPKMKKANVNDEVENDGLESLTQLRGLFGITSEED